MMMMILWLRMVTPQSTQEEALCLRLPNPISQRRPSCLDLPASSLHLNLTWVPRDRGLMMMMMMLMMKRFVVERRTCPRVCRIGLQSYHETHCRCGVLLQCALKIRVGVRLRVEVRLTSSLMKTGHEGLELGSAGDWVRLVVGVEVA